MPKKSAYTALLCAFAVLAPGASAFAAPAASPTAAPIAPSAEIATLRSQIDALKAQKEQPGANGQELDTRIAKLEARLAEIDAARKIRAAGGSPGTAPAAENGGVATKTTITRDQMQSANADNTYDAIKNVPGVTQADAKAGGGSDNLQIRGIHLTSTTGYRLDGGLPMVNNVIMEPEDKEQVQVLKGAGALEYGIASPAGIINYVLKRATRAPVTAITLSGNGFGQAVAGVDIGRRFSLPGNTFGFRLNLAGGDVPSYTQGAGGTRWIGAMTADWTTNKARIRLDYEKYGLNLVENASLLQNKAGANGIITLPKIPNPYSLLSGEWARGIGVGQNVQMQADYRFNDVMSLKAELGRSDADRPRREVSQIGAYNVVTGKGTETVTLIRNQRYTNNYANVEAKFKTKHEDAFENVFTLGFTRSERLGNNPVNSSVTYKQNIYNPVILPAPQEPAGPTQYLPQNSADTDYFFTDSLTVARRLHLTGGLRQINYSADDKLASGATRSSKSAFLAPALGGIFELNRSLSLYASYVKSLEETGSAPINSKNAFDVLPPAAATQKEVGIRAAGPRGFAASLGYFTIDRANATTDPVTQIFGLNGRNFFQGLESTVNMRVAPRWTLTLGGQEMNATQHSPHDPTIDGKIPENVPKLSGNAGLTFQPMPGLQLSGGLQFVGARQLNPQDQGTIPSVTTSSFGVTYTKKINDRRVSFNLSCRNCGDKRYWSSAVNGALGIASPRTVSLSVRIADGQ